MSDARPPDGPEAPRPRPDEPAADPQEEGGDRPRASRGCGWRILKGTTRTVVWTAFVVVLALGFLLRTALGHEVVLGWGLDQVRSRVAGSLEVREIRSATLFKGARLVDVRLATPGGRPLFEADSLEAQWDLFGLLSGAVALRDVFVWGPRFTFERDDSTSTLTRWLGSEPAPPPGPEGAGARADSAGAAAQGGPEGGAGGGVAVEFRDVTLLDGATTLRFALDPEGGGDGSEGGILRTVDEGAGRQLAIDGTDLEIEAPLVQIGERTRIELRDVAGEVFVLEEPFAVQGLRGQLRIQEGQTVVALPALGLPGIRGSGSVVVSSPDRGQGVTHLAFDLDRVDTDHWQWVADGVIPSLRGSTRLRGRIGPAGTRIALADLDAEAGGGRVTGDGAVVVDAGVSFDDVELRFDEVATDVVDRWLAGPVPVAGTVSGPLRLDGPLTALATRGRLALRRRPPERPSPGPGEDSLPAAPDQVPAGPGAEGDAPGLRSVADFEGTLLSGDAGLGVRDFSLRLDPLDWGVVSSVVPGLRIGGSGRLTGQATGSLASGLRFDADALHRAPGGGEPSRVLVDGSVRRTAEGSLVVDVQGDLSPLLLGDVLAGYPEMPVAGRLAGTFRARGPADDLEVQADVESRGGRLDVEARADLTELGRRWSADVVAEGFRLSSVVTALPEPTVVSGRVVLDGRGASREELAGSADLTLGPSTVGRVDVDSTRISARLADGRLRVDTLRIRTEGFEVAGRGELAADSSRPSGRVQLALAADSLAGIRSLFRGDTVVVSDGLTVLDREVLLLQGVDPDTLPRAAEVLAEGRVRGQVSLEGSLQDFDASGVATVTGVRWGGSALTGARLDFTARGLPGVAGRLDADLRVDSVRVGDRSFTRGRVAVDFTRPRGRAVLELGRGEREDYRLVGGFELGSPGGRVELDSLRARIDSLAYRTLHPTRVSWSDSLFRLDSLTLVGSGDDPVRIRAAGTLARSGEEDFTVDIQALRLERLLRILQREELDLAGSVDLRATVGGRARNPTVVGEVQARELATATVRVDSLQGEVDYGEERLSLDVDAWRSGVRVGQVDGYWPLRLDLGGDVGVPDQGDVALSARLDSLPSAFVLGLLEDLEEVEGTIGGEVRLGGTPSRLEPQGTLRVTDGAWTVGALGVRQEDVQGTLALSPDRSVDVDARARSGGTLEVQGTIRLDTLGNPGLDLSLDLDDFDAVDRRDIQGAVSGALTLRGRYQAPVIEGDLQVDRGNLYLEEFQRNLGVVDLSDPRFFAVDTSLVQSQSVLAATRNPFLDNLLVIIDLAVDRNTWIRSPDLNVEMQGDLSLTFDRRQRDVVFVGELQAVRGQYNLYSRTFEVDEGTVEFVGIPGINPNLDIQARTRVRRRDGDPLTITANVEGTLVEPRVSLGSEEAAVAESDLLSYLVFGQSSAQTTTGNVGQVASQAGTAAAAALGGTLTSSLAALAQGTGFLDYLSISQAVDATTVGNTSTLGAFSGTQVEVGRYFGGGDYFGALVLRPLAGVGSRGSVLGGARIEWQASDQYHLEVFAEDQFLRVGSVGFQDLGINSFLIYGVALYREWGY
jgi:hypothetical protein